MSPREREHERVAPYVPPYGLSQQELDGAANRCAELLCNGADWIYRRKESVTLLDERTLRRRMSVDLELTDALPQPRKEEFLVPLFFLEKGRAQSTHFDFADETGRSLTLPTRADNGLVSTAILHVAAASLIGEGAMSPDLWESLAVIAQCDQEEAEAELLSIGLVGADAPEDPAVVTLSETPDFVWLAGALATSSVLLMPIEGEIGDRKIIKLSFDQTVEDVAQGPRRGYLRAGWTGYRCVVDNPFVGAGTSHFEVHVPTGVEIAKARWLSASRSRIAEVCLHGPASHTHLYLPDAADQRSGIAILDLRLGRAGFATGAAIASGVVVAVLALFVAAAGEIAKAATSAPSLLLALPGVIATYILRVEDSTMTARLLVWARTFLLVSAFAAYGAALRIGLDPATPADPLSASDLRQTWVPLLTVAIVAFVCLVVTRFFPRIQHE